MVFIDDYTGFTVVVPLRSKDEFCDAFEPFLRKYERPERRCHRIRLDQAGENTSDKVYLLCSDRGIALETTGTEQY